VGACPARMRPIRASGGLTGNSMGCLYFEHEAKASLDVFKRRSSQRRNTLHKYCPEHANTAEKV
jgi:hypothetical protein